MLENDSRSLASSIAGLILVSFLTFPSIFGIVSHLRSAKTKATGYQDKDGIATPASIDTFSARVPKTLLTIFNILGLSTAAGLAILDTLAKGRGTYLGNWLNVAQWALLVVQNVGLVMIRDSVKTFALGIYESLACIVLLAVLLFQDGLISKEEGGFGTSPVVSLRICQLFLVTFSSFASVSLPRRPEVLHNGKPVDGMYTVSALSRYSFAWVEKILALSRKNNRLELSDLPNMDHYTRSRELSSAWNGRDTHKHSLWFEVFLAHKNALFIQWVLTLLQAFGNFAPQFVTYYILRILENRAPGAPIGPEAWIWVVALTLTTIGSAWIESWLFWVSWSEIAIPIRSQLSALVFQKAMRRKDVKGASKTSEKVNTEGSQINPSCETTTNDKPEVEEDDDSNPKGRQSTVNLIGVDCKRISDFGSFNNYFPGSFFKLVVSFAFLLAIIGWKALLAGFIAMSLTIPLNIFWSKRYASAQDRVMKVRDVKMSVVTEALQGIRQIKFSALESNWHEKIGKVRERELMEQWNVYVADTFLLFCWISSPIALAATSLAVYAYLNGGLSPSVAFTSIGVFSNLEVTLSVIPELTTDLIDAYVSILRIEKYLKAPEITKNTNDSQSISFESASVAWPSDAELSDPTGCTESEDEQARYILRNISLSFPNKELSVVSGKTGTGKSLLLAAILGEVDLLSGSINVPRPPKTKDRYDELVTNDNWIIPSSIAFVAQIPWIENASIKDNILFGLPFDEYRYNKVIEVCALSKDLDMLADGEATEIGANGINLSGGQRWRVTFARALYSRAGILVLDDIFSAVDAHVGRFIFEKGLTGELGVGRTRILVTHHVALCQSKAKYIVELGDGTIEHSGLLSELSEETLQQIIKHEETETEDEEITEVSPSEESFDGETGVGENLRKVDSKKSSHRISPKKFVEEEARERGHVKMAVYSRYMNSSGGWPFWTLAFLLFGALQVLTTGRSWWVRLWTGSDQQTTSMSATIASLHAHTIDYNLQKHMSIFSLSNSTVFTKGDEEDRLSYYLSIYVGLSVVSALLGTFRYWYIYTGSIRASRKLFDKLCFTILRTPLRWMDTVPLGRILNRFTADFNIVDSRLSNDIGFGGNNVFRLIGVIIAGIFVSPYVILLSVVLFALCIYIASLYINGAREVKRLESSTKSPVFEQFGSALTGVGTIRAFDKTDVYIERMYSKIDDHSTSFWHLWAFNRWMGWRMSLIGGFFASFVAVMVLLMKDIDAALAGFALSFALEYGQVVIWTIRHYTNLELDMNAAERIIEYSELQTESLDGIDPPAAWPSKGRLEVNDLVVSYAPDLPPVLKGLNFTAERNERIGVVGRTGAGKSSLTLAIFRFLEARQGSIHIDGLDISKIKLHALRSRLAIIPQDPVLFSGTIRTNLDAFDQHTDTELRDALERVHLVSNSEFLTTPALESESTGTSTPTVGSNKNFNPFTTLASPISEGGLNLSQGQRQLLCLARAIVSRPKIMVLDEATSAVDMETDALIQRSIREEFDDSTLIVIAHRLSTIADFDKILVLDDGKAVEFGTPKELMHLGDGVFKGMVGESGERSKLEEMILGKGHPSS